jgi:radical SAM enzyme (TIGR01210 family)
VPSSYPISATERDQWILTRRPERNVRDPWQPYAFLCEPETGPAGLPVPVATVFLTNRECPYRCLMCDLWRDTLEETVPPGAIAAQVRYALDRLPPARWLKLYNAGSFFDPRAIPEAEYEAVAQLAAPFERVIVECHPALVGPRMLRFRDLLAQASGGCARLEVAMGLETIHPVVLPRLNKRMTLERFQAAAALLAQEEIALRTFLLLRPPWLSEAEGVEWACRSLEFAAECGAEVCTVIPTRAGNGALEELAVIREFAPPTLPSLEAALEYGLRMGGPRVFADLWDAERFTTCRACSPARLARLAVMNDSQRVPSPIACVVCGVGEPAA